MKRLKILASLLLVLALVFTTAQAGSWKASKKNSFRLRLVMTRMESAVRNRGYVNRTALDALMDMIREESEGDYCVCRAIVDHWYAVAENPDYTMYFYDEKEIVAERLMNSGLIPDSGHAFVVMGYELRNGAMAPELKGRCDAAAEAARSFPESILVCTGGATGSNNPKKNTEAGLMKKYLVEKCGIDESRILTDTEARSTVQNAVNTIGMLGKAGISSFTIITSDYHQRWSQILFNAMAAIYEVCTGNYIRLTGNFNYPVKPNGDFRSGVETGVKQVQKILTKSYSFEE